MSSLDPAEIDIRARRHAAYGLALQQRPDAVSRRRFLELMGASLALAGAAACAPPREQIVPYVRPPEEVVPSKPLYYATAHVLGGYGQGVLVEVRLEVIPPAVTTPDDLLDAGINDWGGISPLTPDFINPEKPWPHLEQLKLRTEAKGFKLRQRLPVYPEFLPAVTARPGLLAEKVKVAADSEGYARRTG